MNAALIYGKLLTKFLKRHQIQPRQSPSHCVASSVHLTVREASRSTTPRNFTELFFLFSFFVSSLYSPELWTRVFLAL